MESKALAVGLAHTNLANNCWFRNSNRLALHMAITGQNSASHDPRANTRLELPAMRAEDLHVRNQFKSACL
jgi:hypothetical protein